MARITVDDCIKFLPNRFELALEDLISIVHATRVSRAQQAVRLSKLIGEFR